jgi:Flp pilus assembly protein TadG
MNSHASQLASRLKCQAGMALVEFTLVAPLFLLLVYGMFDFGRVFNYWNDATQLSHEGARFAAVDKIPDPDSATLSDWLRARADTTELRDGSASVTGPIDVCLRFPEGNSNVGSSVTVQVSFTYTFMSFLGLDVASKEITQESTMRIERPIKTLAGEPICPA